MICASANLFFLNRTSSYAFPRQFYFQESIVCRGITKAGNFERNATTVAAFIRLAMIRIMLRHEARSIVFLESKLLDRP